MSALPPRHLCIVGALIIASGVASVADMIAALIDGRFTFELGILAIPVGYGILIGRDSARSVALFFAMLGFLFSIGYGGWLAYEHWTGGGLLPPNLDSVSIIAAPFFAGVPSLYVLVVLRRSRHMEWFAAVQEERTAAGSLAWAVAVVAASLLFSLHAMDRYARKTLAQVYSFRVRVVPFDAANGKGMERLSYHRDADFPKGDLKLKLPEMAVATIGGTEGMQYEFSGVAVEPIEVTLKSEGFQDKTITLDKQSGKEIRVPMQPLGAGKAEADASVKPAATRTGSD